MKSNHRLTNLVSIDDQRTLQRESRIQSLLAAFGLLLFAAGCSGTMQIASTESAHKVTIDGQIDEWNGELHEIKDQQAVIGVKHEKNYVTLAFSTGDPDLIRQILLGGLYVWFNGQGDKSKELGILYPISVSPAGGGQQRSRDQTDTRSPREQPEVSSDYEVLIGESTTRHAPSDETGIELMFTLTYDQFTYELKIPVGSSGNSTRYSVTSPSSAQFGIGMETGQLPARDSESEGSRTNASGGGRGSGGRGASGGGRGRSGGQGRGSTDESAKLDFWVVVSIDPENK